MKNEYGEWEDEHSLADRVDEAKERMRQRMLAARRLHLHEISRSPGKRAAFEILTQLPIDWDKAKTLEPQEDEPWRVVNMREPAMLLTAENGWLGDMLPGPDKMAELRQALDEERVSRGLEPVDWEGEDEEEGDE